MDTSIKPRGAAKPRVRRATAVVPEMTDPLGMHWRAPKREKIFIGDDVAYMSKASFDALPEYSRSTPSGVYPGKMWKAEIYERGPDGYPTPTGRWLLRWFGNVEGKPHLCSNHSREIEIVVPKAKARATGMSPNIAAPYGQPRMSDREWAAMPANLREGCTVHVPGVGDL